MKLLTSILTVLSLSLPAAALASDTSADRAALSAQTTLAKAPGTYTKPACSCGHAARR
jgi:hypothetical protein